MYWASRICFLLFYFYDEFRCLIINNYDDEEIIRDRSSNGSCRVKLLVFALYG